MPSASSEAAPRRLAGQLAVAVVATGLSATAAGSTAAAAWVLGTQRLPLVALLGSLAVGVLAVSGRRLRWALPLSLALAVPVSLVAAGWNPWQLPAASLGDLRAMLAAIRLGAAGNSRLPDFLVFLAFWANAAWLGWIAIRGRRPLIAVAPTASIVASNVLNAPAGQVSFVLALVFCCCALLLVSAYERSTDEARRRGIWLNDDVRWNFWEMGVAVSIAVLAIAALVPPISTVNRSLALQNQLFHGLDALHAGTAPSAATSSAGATIGYSREVRLAGPLRESRQVVFTYSSDLDLPEPYYFAGDTATEPADGAWAPADGGDQLGVLPKDTTLPWNGPVAQQQTARFDVTVETPPAAAPRTIFYPGQLQKASIPTALLVEYGVYRQKVVAVAAAQDATGVPKHYQVTVAGSTATAAELAQAGAGYPGWVEPDAQPLDANYLPAKVLAQIRELALRAVAGVPADPYDEATAIQNYLRANYTYTLTPKPVPRGEDALEAFLDRQTGGYCVYFATAMADMLRSLGLPVVLVNGFGSGSFDATTGQYVVRASDAHTWPEVYFPGYGWIPFEPTPQPGYGPIPRGGATPTCAAAACGLAPIAGGLGSQSQIQSHDKQDVSGGGGGAPAPDNRGLSLRWPVAGALLLLLLALLAVCAWWLRPRTLAATWRRTRRLAALAGVRLDLAESPLEFGHRLGEAVPSVAAAARALADEVTVAAYAPGATAASPPGVTRAAWATLRSRLLRRALRRRLGRRRPQPAA